MDSNNGTREICLMTTLDKFTMLKRQELRVEMGCTSNWDSGSQSIRKRQESVGKNVEILTID